MSTYVTTGGGVVQPPRSRFISWWKCSKPERSYRATEGRPECTLTRSQSQDAVWSPWLCQLHESRLRRTSLPPGSLVPSWLQLSPIQRDSGSVIDVHTEPLTCDDALSGMQANAVRTCFQVGDFLVDVYTPLNLSLSRRARGEVVGVHVNALPNHLLPAHLSALTTAVRSHIQPPPRCPPSPTLG